MCWHEYGGTLDPEEPFKTGNTRCQPTPSVKAGCRYWQINSGSCWAGWSTLSAISSREASKESLHQNSALLKWSELRSLSWLLLCTGRGLGSVCLVIARQWCVQCRSDLCQPVWALHSSIRSTAISSHTLKKKKKENCGQWWRIDKMLQTLSQFLGVSQGGAETWCILNPRSAGKSFIDGSNCRILPFFISIK